MGFVFLAFVLLIGYLSIKKIFKAFRQPANDLSFGRKDFLATGLFIQNKKYLNAETMLSQLDSDDLTQCIDHITLTLPLKYLQDFHEHSSTKELSALILGVYFSHQAWTARGNALADEVKSSGASKFYDYLQQSIPLLEMACKHQYFSAEAHSRLIRVMMGQGNETAAINHFKLCTAIEPEHVWAYLHYAECIQPKWGGTVDQIKQLMKAVPNNELIKAILRLKLIYDGHCIGQNYFDESMTEEQLKSFILEILMAYDNDSGLSSVQSIHKFVFFGYMFTLSTVIGEKSLSKKYQGLIGSNYTLYPFGILK